ncbi:MAG TPA: hypothetical protein VE616_09505 [Candidatus Udaeobacter sp.]|nr:hypothetical protein [Candidatus Udaeobacter sp.]
MKAEALLLSVITAAVIYTGGLFALFQYVIRLSWLVGLQTNQLAQELALLL